MKTSILLLLIFLTSSCSLPKEFVSGDQPSAPDYSNPANWSSLPFRKDAADDIPKQEIWVNDTLKMVDVFYVYPTLYSKGNTWNADVNKKKLNKRIDKLPVRLQASAFNQIGRVYAPRYRQANVDAYSDKTGIKQKALDFAYQDVKLAFEYYMDHYNNGRPIIIASHSQGSNHTVQLLKDYFDNPEMKSKLVAAYMVGIAVDSNKYIYLQPCKNPNETNCYVTWSSYKEGYELDSIKDNSEILVGNVCVNPISWKINEEKSSTNGGVLLNLSRKKTYTTTAQIHKDYLSIKTNTFLFKRKNELHLIDYNMFWHDIRTNSRVRVTEYFK